MHETSTNPAVAAVLAVDASGSLFLAADQPPPAERPNPWLVSEDTSPLLGCYGDPWPARQRSTVLPEGSLPRCFASGVRPVAVRPDQRMYAAIAVRPPDAGQGPHPEWLRGFRAGMLRDAVNTLETRQADYNSPLRSRTPGTRAARRRTGAIAPRRPAVLQVFNHGVTTKAACFLKRNAQAFPPHDRPNAIPPYLPNAEMRADAAGATTTSP